MAETNSFSMRYDGPDLVDHAISINDLAPALISLGDLLNEANRILNHGAPKLSIKVKAFQEGSFTVDILVNQTLLEQAKDLLTGKTVSSVANVCSVLGIGGISGIIYLIQWLRGNPPKKAVQQSPSTVEIINIENNVITISNDVYTVYRSPLARKALYNIVKPAESEGITSVEFFADDGQPVKVLANEVPFFHPDCHDEELKETEREVYVNVENAWLSGQEKRKWKFREGQDGAAWNAEMEDLEFIDKLTSGTISLSGADTLRVLLKQTQYNSGGAVKSNYIVLKVLEHIKGYLQSPMNFTTDTSTG
jgi:hypothetical protein